MPGIWTWIKNKAAGSTLGIRGLLTTSDPIATYVYDSREVLTCNDGRRCKYPENYDEIVKIIKEEEKDDHGQSVKDENGAPKYKYRFAYKIIKEEEKDDHGQPVKDKNGELKYKYRLTYKGNEFNLALVKKGRNNRSYFTIDFPVPIRNLDKSYFEPFKFSRIDLEEHIPIFEVETSFRLAKPPVPCKVEEAKDNNGKSIKDKDGNLKYILSYEEVVEDKEEKKEVKFDLALIKKIGDKSYFTTDFLLNPKGDNNSKYYDLFKSSIVPLEGRYVFEVDTSRRLANSSVLDEKGRNGKLLFTSYYGKPSTDPPKNKTEAEAEVIAKFNAKTKTHFSEIRDQNNNIEWDKSLISVPIVLASGLAKVFANWLTYIPMKLGEFLISKKNPIAKAFGYPLFTAGAIVKHSVNMLSTILKAPILLFVANEKKYGDKYYTKLEHQLIGHWDELKSDLYFIINGKREPEQEEKRPNLEFTGTWDELNNIKPGIKKDLEETKNSKKASAKLSKSQGAETLQLTPEKKADQTLRLSNKVAKELKAAVSREEITALDTQPTVGNSHVDRLQQNPRPAPSAPSPFK